MMIDNIKDSADKPKRDPRVRMEVGDYRVVAPNGRSKDGRFFINGSLVIEKKGKDSLGVEQWTTVSVVTKPDSPCKDEVETAFFWILAGHGAE